jgi:four helix bundle protein
MNYSDWVKSVPKELNEDPLWRSEVCRLALFAGDIAWRDAAKLAEICHTLSMADQLLRATGSISANICEGYSRASGKDQARFYEYALGSAREARDWYFKARHSLGSTVTEHRLDLLAQICRHLLRMIPKYRGNTVKEESVSYDAQSTDWLTDDVPTSDL